MRKSPFQVLIRQSSPLNEALFACQSGQSNQTAADYAECVMPGAQLTVLHFSISMQGQANTILAMSNYLHLHFNSTFVLSL